MAVLFDAITEISLEFGKLTRFVVSSTIEVFCFHSIILRKRLDLYIADQLKLDSLHRSADKIT
jgi:hypothetical protein